MEYEARQRELNLPSLYYERERPDMLGCCKYMTSKYDVPTALLSHNERGATGVHTVKPMKLFLARNERGATQGYTVKPIKLFLERNERGATRGHTVKPMKLFLSGNERGTTGGHCNIVHHENHGPKIS